MRRKCSFKRRAFAAAPAKAHGALFLTFKLQKLCRSCNPLFSQGKLCAYTDRIYPYPDDFYQYTDGFYPYPDSFNSYPDDFYP